MACAVAIAKTFVSLKLIEISLIPFFKASAFALPFNSICGGPYFLITTISLGLTPWLKPTPKTLDTASFAAKFFARK